MTSRRDAIAADLRSRITSGRIKAGARLPSEVQLASSYAVSPPTLRAALAVLQGEGLIEKVHGKGSFVRGATRRITYVGGCGTTQAETPAEAALHVSVSTTRLQARGQLAGLLKVPAGSPLTELRCLSHDGTSPRSLARIYVPCDISSADIPDGPSWCMSVAARLEDLRTPVVKVQEITRARLPTPEEAAALHISSSLAVLTVTRLMADSAGRIVEATLLVLPGDRAEASFTTYYTTDGRRTEER